MDGLRFDAWTRRRVALAASTLLTGLVGLVPRPGAAKKGKNKKKCQKPKVKCKKKCCKAGQACSGGKCAPPEACQLAKTATVWRLLSDCTIRKTLDIPFGVSFDGNGKTISLSGSVNAFKTSAGVRGGTGDTDVHDLIMDGSGLTGSCEPGGVVLLFWNGGHIDNVEVRNNRCGTGIDGRDVAVNGASVLGMRDFGIDVGIVGGPSSVMNSTVRDCGWGLVDFEGGAQFVGNTLERVGTGIWIAAQRAGAQATVQNNTLRNVTTGIISIGSMDATGNTLVGPGLESTSRSAGIYFDDGSSGSASGNTISNFRFDHPSQVSCAIVVQPGAGAVTIGENTFPDPPGNDANFCPGF